MAHTRWGEQLKPGDHYRAIEHARHFFQYQEANQTADVIESFLDMVPEEGMNNRLMIKSDYSPTQISKND
jgi:ubiquinone biosynthesis protein COQ9